LHWGFDELRADRAIHPMDLQGAARPVPSSVEQAPCSGAAQGLLNGCGNAENSSSATDVSDSGGLSQSKSGTVEFIEVNFLNQEIKKINPQQGVEGRFCPEQGEQIFLKGLNVELLQPNGAWSNGYQVLMDDGSETIKFKTPTGRTTKVSRRLVR
jgi:hypothetical protein